MAVMSKTVSTSQAALDLGISAPLIKTCLEQGLLSGDGGGVDVASLESFRRQLSETISGRANSVLALIEANKGD
jgi:hypothetical protein